MSPSKKPKSKTNKSAKGGGKVKVHVEKDVTGAEGDESLSDEDLGDVTGGVTVQPIQTPPPPIKKPTIRME